MFYVIASVQALYMAKISRKYSGNKVGNKDAQGIYINGYDEMEKK